MATSSRIFLFFVQTSWLFYIVGILTVVTSVTAGPGGDGGKKGPHGPHCLMGDITEDKKAILKKCSTASGLEEMKEAFPKKKVETLEEFDVDDKCFFECVYKESGSAEDGKIKKDAADTMFKGNLTSETKTKLNTIWNSCIDDCEKIMANKADKKCMLFPLHMFCVKKKSHEEKLHENC